MLRSRVKEWECVASGFGEECVCVCVYRVSLEITILALLDSTPSGALCLCDINTLPVD